MGATQRLNTGRSSQFADSGGGGGGDADRVIADEASETGGEFTTSSATFVSVTGTSLSFNLTDPKNVRVSFEFTGHHAQADTDIQAFYGIDIDGTQYTKGILQSSLPGGGQFFVALHVEKELDLAAGAHTAALLLRSDGAHNSRIVSSTDAPTVSVADYIAGTGGGGGGDIKADGTVPFAADESMGDNNLTDVADPVNPQDAETRVDAILLKSFFRNQGLLPANVIREDLDDLDTFDSVSAGSVSYLMSRGKLTNVEGYLGYDLGAEYDKILFVFGMVKTFTQNGGIWFADTLAAGVPQDGAMFMNESNSARTSLYTLPAFASIVQDTAVYTPAGAGGHYPMMALYLDLAAHRAVAFYRFGGEMWWPVFDVTDAVNITLTQARYIGAYLHNGPGFVGCPVGIYAE